LREAKVTAVWILLSATLRAEDDYKLASALQVDIDVIVRDKLQQPQNVNIQVIQSLSIETAALHAKSFKPQIIYVKTYADATKVRSILKSSAHKLKIHRSPNCWVVPLSGDPSCRSNKEIKQSLNLKQAT
jgi:hypothetical protein